MRPTLLVCRSFVRFKIKAAYIHFLSLHSIKIRRTERYDFRRDCLGGYSIVIVWKSEREIVRIVRSRRNGSLGRRLLVRRLRRLLIGRLSLRLGIPACRSSRRLVIPTASQQLHIVGQNFGRITLIVILVRPLAGYAGAPRCKSAILY